MIKTRSGLDELDLNLVAMSGYNDVVIKFACLIDFDNENTIEEHNRSLRLEEHRYTNDIIKRLGFDHVFDKKLIDRSVFIKKVEETIQDLLQQWRVNKNFNLVMIKSKHSIQKIKEVEFKKQLAYINSLLYGYSVKIKLKQVRNESQMETLYQIELQHNIDELLEYRVNKGVVLKDSKAIFVKP